MDATKRTKVFALALALFAGVLCITLARTSAAVNTLTINTNADAYVNSTSPTTNFGKNVSLYADGSPDVKSVIGFAVSGINGAKVTAATLKIYAQSANTNGVGVAAYTDSDWTETGLTYSTFDSPAVGPILSTVKPITSGTWLSFNVTSAVTTDGAVSFVLVPNNSTNTKFASREAGTATQPQLIITTDDSTTTQPPPPCNPPNTMVNGVCTPPANPCPPPNTLVNGVCTPPVTTGDPVIAAAGDIACDPSNSSFNGGNGSGSSCRQASTAVQLNNAAAVLLLGDNQYYCGGLSAYLQSYDLSWGKFKSITHPSIGNHEYLTSGGTGCDSSNLNGAGYFNYFGQAAGQQGKGYYSYDVGTWHLIALNSNCSQAGGCSSTSPQGQWLASDLAAHTNACTLAYWHIPVWSSGGRASQNMASITQQLYNANVDVVLTGHDHIYERFAPQNAASQPDSTRGIQSFVVGTGGANHTSIATIMPNSVVRNANTFGVIKMTLHPTSYDWSFQPSQFTGNGTFIDSGTMNCH